MLFSHTYNEIKNNSQALYKEKGSKFLSYALKAYNEQEIKKKIEEIKKIENSANHYCYAYTLHPDRSLSRFSDDGEPNYTAGKPISKVIAKFELTNILIVVVRYFGGVKLGIPGLIRSYKIAATNAIEKNQLITKIIKEKYTILFDHEHMNTVMQIIKNYNLEITNTDFQIKCKLTFLVSKQKSDLVLLALRKNHKLKIQF
tara:strand:+ start:4098 stop:4700 length:603 start_codon:yes stop_codon:yes gene_type:complete